MQQGQWVEEEWMAALQREYQTKSSELYRSGENEKDRTPDRRVRSKEILDALTRKLREKDYFLHYSNSSIATIVDHLISTGLSWLCCDAYLCLDELADANVSNDADIW
jgi:hypothetical protein